MSVVTNREIEKMLLADGEAERMKNVIFWAWGHYSHNLITAVVTCVGPAEDEEYQ